MTNLSDYHKFLIFGKIANSLTQQELAEIDTLLEENPDLLKAYYEIRSGFPEQMIEHKFEHLDHPGYWRDLTTEFETRSRQRIKKIVIRALSLAAVLVGVIIISRFFFTSNKPHTKNVVIKTEAVQLQLANGKLINLSEQQGNIHEGNTKIVNKSKSLSYSVTGNEGQGINSVIVPFGMDYKIVLSDGTQVWMNSDTKLDFPFQFSNESRVVTIKGEAYLEVAKDAKRPFIVHLPSSTVNVLGTTFNINTYDKDISRVSLVSGKVSVRAGAQELMIKPGYEAIYNGRHLTKAEFDQEKVLSWMSGIYYFDESDLKHISNVLHRWYGVKTVIDNSALNKKRFAGMIDKNQSLNTFLEDLKAISKIESYFDKDGVLHFK